MKLQNRYHPEEQSQLEKTVKRSFRLGLLAFVLFIVGNVHAGPWVTAYVGGWWLGINDNGQMPISRIDFRGMTVCDHMALIPTVRSPFIDTALTDNWVTNGMSSQNSLKLTRAAHLARVKCIFTIGAGNTREAFLSATNPANLNAFVATLVDFMEHRHYDGVDIDWEPLRRTDVDQWEDLIVALRKMLPSPKYLITVTAGWGSPTDAYESIQGYVDQINIMTYDFDTDASGYNSWYSGSVYSAGVVAPFDNRTPVPSCDYMVGQFEKAGIAASKLGIGCEPGGDLWIGINGPDQSIASVTSWKPDISYNEIVRNYFQPQIYHWDDKAEAAYLGCKSHDGKGDWFLSFDDTKALKAKLEYVREAGIGGLIIYEIGMSYDKASGRNPFLDVSRDYLRRDSSPKGKSIRKIHKQIKRRVFNITHQYSEEQTFTRREE